MNIHKYKLYITSSYLKILAKVTLIFLCLVFILNIIEEINFFGDTSTSISFPIILTLLNSPSIVYELFPFILLISTKVFFIDLINKEELIIFRNYGISNLKILSVLLINSFIMGILIITIFYNASAKFKFLYLELKNSFSSDNKYLAVITENGIWIKDEIENNINIINAEKIEKNLLNNITITQFDNNFNFLKSIISKKADIKGKEWKIYNAVISSLDNEQLNLKELNFVTNFDSKKINSLFENLSSLTIWELMKQKKDYKVLGYSTTEIESHSYKIYSYPVYLVLMTLIPSIIMFNISHNKPKIYFLVVGVLLSVLIYYINYLSNLLGQNQQLPLLLSIWLPFILLFIISSIGLVNINEK